jgi:probable HAF family extracellular repeat protein
MIAAYNFLNLKVLMMNRDIRQANGFFRFLLPAALLGVIASAPAMAYNLIDLGPNVEPRAINNLGVVVGSSNTDQYPATAFSWSSDSGFELINGGVSANALNDNGQIAGTTIDGAFIDNRDWSDYGAFGINQAGEVAGYKVGKNLLQPRSLPYNPAIFNGNKWEVYDIARLYPRGTRQDVYADRFILNSINKSGYTVGYKYRYGLATYSAILIDPNITVNDLSDVVYLPTYGGRAVDINDSNMIAGTTGSSSSTTPVTYSQAFIYDYDMGNLTVLPILEEGLRSHAYDINESNEVVGYSESAAGNHAVLWNDTGAITDLHTLMSAEGWVLTSATAINDNGDITGTGTLNGAAHGFVLSTGTFSGPPPAENQPPVAVAIADPASGKAPLMVNFSSESYDPDGVINSYAWDSMDGSFSATEANTSHEFATPGTYQVILTITDDLGMQSTSSTTITVRKGKRK